MAKRRRSMFGWFAKLLPWVNQKPEQNPIAPPTKARRISAPSPNLQNPVKTQPAPARPRPQLSRTDLARVIKVPESLAGLAHYEDMVLYVSQDHKDTAAVFHFEGNLRRQGLLKAKTPVSLADIKTRTEEARRHALPEIRDEKQSVGLARELIAKAVSMRASDIHFEIYQDSHCVVKYRIDSYLRPIMELLPHVATSMVTAVYNLADGKNKMEWMREEICFSNIKSPEILPGELSGIRFSSTRMSTGAFIALRILPKNVSSSGRFEDLGVSPIQIAELQDMLRTASGMVLFTGPTGAGKSTLLKYSIEWLQDQYPLSNTITVEDPVEYQIKGAKQIDVLIQDNEDPSVDERGMAWARVIATTLRLDPNRLMISEIRDGAAAIAGFRAAQTGHPTLSTTHTNDGWESFNRLADLLREGGMTNPYGLLANTKNFVGATAQRLLPRLCSKCKVPLFGNEHRIGGKQSKLYCDLAAAVEDFPMKARGIYLRGDGCNSCVPEFADKPEAQKVAAGGGIYGRTLVLEIVRPTQRHYDIALQDGTPAARRQWLVDGGRIMMDHAIEKVISGEITPEVLDEFVGEIQTSRQIIKADSRERTTAIHRAEAPRVLVDAGTRN